MASDILFIQGGGDAGHDVDAGLVAALRAALGPAFDVCYPRFPEEEDEPTLVRAWSERLTQALGEIGREVILVAHSFGASLLLKYLTEHEVETPIAGVFLLATPFWGEPGSKPGSKSEAFMLRRGFADKLPAAPIFLYHCRDDEVVPFAHLALYARRLARAVVRERPTGGHQFGNDLTQVARDIEALGGHAQESVSRSGPAETVDRRDASARRT